MISFWVNSALTFRSLLSFSSEDTLSLSYSSSVNEWMILSSLVLTSANLASRQCPLESSSCNESSSGRLYVGRWNERVRAKRCDAVDWGLLKRWGDSTYLHSNFDLLRSSTKLPSMWISNFFGAYFVLRQSQRVSFSGIKTGLWISRCGWEWVRSSRASCTRKLLNFVLWMRMSKIFSR